MYEEDVIRAAAAMVDALADAIRPFTAQNSRSGPARRSTPKHL